jgi:hypothetical protein
MAQTVRLGELERSVRVQPSRPPYSDMLAKPVHVAFCSTSACKSFEPLVDVDTHCSGVALMGATIQLVYAEALAVIALRISLERAGLTGTCWATKAGGSCLYSSFILLLGVNVRWWNVIGNFGGTSHSNRIERTLS